MTAIFAMCVACAGMGHLLAPPSWTTCKACDGIGRVWAPGAPAFGCQIMLGQRVAGEVVELGNGDRGRILWHSPRPVKKVRAVTTYLGLIDDFDGSESHRPVGYPSCVGVRSVEAPCARGDSDDHGGERGPDQNDPMQRRGGALL